MKKKKKTLRRIWFNRHIMRKTCNENGKQRKRKEDCHSNQLESPDPLKADTCRFQND